MSAAQAVVMTMVETGVTCVTLQIKTGIHQTHTHKHVNVANHCLFLWSLTQPYPSLHVPPRKRSCKGLKTYCVIFQRNILNF